MMIIEVWEDLRSEFPELNDVPELQINSRVSCTYGAAIALETMPLDFVTEALMIEQGLHIHEDWKSILDRMLDGSVESLIGIVKGVIPNPDNNDLLRFALLHEAGHWFDYKASGLDAVAYLTLMNNAHMETLINAESLTFMTGRDSWPEKPADDYAISKLRQYHSKRVTGMSTYIKHVFNKLVSCLIK